MARTPDDRAAGLLAHRLAELRRERFGEHGGPLLAMLVRVTHREWYGYETGRPVPASVLRRVAELTDTNLEWLRTGQGPKGDRPDSLDLGFNDRW